MEQARFRGKISTPELVPLIDPFVHDFLKPQSLFRLVDDHESPVHFIFPQKLQANVLDFRGVLRKKNISAKIFFACKANKSAAFIKAALRADIGVEVSSIYELRAALSYGIQGSNIILSGPAKKKSCLQLAIEHGCTVALDDSTELTDLIYLLERQKVLSASVLIRINDVTNQISRFGVPKKDLTNMLKLCTKNRRIVFRGFSFHINNYSPEDRARAIFPLGTLLLKARKQGSLADIIDIGGGFTTQYVSLKAWLRFMRAHRSKRIVFFAGRNIAHFYPYASEHPKASFLENILEYKNVRSSATVADFVRQHKIKLFIEPGRSLLDQCGFTVMRVLQVKTVANGQKIVVVAGNINHLSEQWFNSEFLVDPILLRQYARSKTDSCTAFIAGNLCLESDMLAWRAIHFKQTPEKGDLLIFYNTAGYQMDSNESEFNRIPLPRKMVVTKTSSGWSCVPESRLFPNK